MNTALFFLTPRFIPSFSKIEFDGFTQKTTTRMGMERRSARGGRGGRKTWRGLRTSPARRFERASVGLSTLPHALISWVCDIDYIHIVS
jgi:hypothetical protein